MARTRPSSYDIDLVRSAARGRWGEIIARTCAVDADLFSGQHGPCPKCGGTDRFRAFDDFGDAGGCICNQCHKDKNGDGFATIQWLQDCKFGGALKIVADYLGIEKTVDATVPAPSAPRRKRKNGSTPVSKQDAAPQKQTYGSTSLEEAVQGYASWYEWKHEITLDREVDFWLYQDVEGQDAYAVVRLNSSQGKHYCPFYLDIDLWRTGDPPATKGRNPDQKLPLFGLSRLEIAPVVYVVEGEKAAEAAQELGLIVTTSAHGAGSASRTDWTPLAGRQIIFIPDNDESGENYVSESAEILEGLEPKPEIGVKRLPGLEPKQDIFDFIQFRKESGQDAAVIIQEIAKLPAGQPKPLGKPKILITTDEPAVVDQAVDAISCNPAIFKRGGMLTYIIREEKTLKGIIAPPNAPRIVPLPLPTLREKMAGAAAWLKLRKVNDDEFEEVPAHPPEWAIKAVNCRGSWPNIRTIEGVTETPVLKHDGAILDIPGYDPETGLLYEPRGEFPSIPLNPTLDDAKAAAETLLDVVVDFPFLQPSHRSGWLAAVLTPFTRYAFHGPAPMFTVEANVPGAGKSLATDVISEIVCGCPMARMTNSSNDEEIRKRITTLAMEGVRMVLIDNVNGILGCASLDAALTGTTWTDRILGTSGSTGQIPLAMTWYATGNNIAFNGDTTRRIVPIRLESNLERPEEREGFKHPHLIAHVRENRGKLVAAALTILRAYCAAGRPKQRMRSWGSFEGWSDLVRQAIVWCGLEDPHDGREEMLQHSNGELASLKTLIAGWQEATPIDGATIAEVFRKLEANMQSTHINHGHPGYEPLKYETLRTAIADISGKPIGVLPSPRSFGMRMNKLRNRVVDGNRLTSAMNNVGTQIWWVEECSETGERTFSGTTGITGTSLNGSVGKNEQHTFLEENRNIENVYICSVESPCNPSSPCPTETPSECVHEWATEATDGMTLTTCEKCGKVWSHEDSKLENAF